MSSRIYTTDCPVAVYWERKREEILQIVRSETFPCVFGRKAANVRSLYWLFHESSDDPMNFIAGLIEYTNFIKNTPPEERLLRPLITVIKSDIKTLADQQKLAWEFIQLLIEKDPAPWPNNIARDVDNHNWCLCFNSNQLFINISCPGHKMVRSRNLGSEIFLVINPREIFDIVAPRNKTKGLKIRSYIRDRIKEYNTDEKIPDQLGFFGDPNNKEWKQYQLNEINGFYFNECPLRMKKGAVT